MRDAGHEGIGPCKSLPLEIVYPPCRPLPSKNEAKADLMQIREVLRAVPLAVCLASPAHALERPGPVTPGASSSAVRKPAVAAARGDWRQWRGNPQHTGYQGLAGHIAAPAIEWRYRLGGAVAAHQVLVSRNAAGSGANLFVGVGGRLQGFDATGASIFDRNPRLRFEILGSWDFGGDGKREILAAPA